MKDPREIVEEVFETLPEEIKERFGTEALEQITEKLKKMQDISDRFADEIVDYFFDINIQNSPPAIGLQLLDDMLRATGVRVLYRLRDRIKEGVAIHEAVNKDPKLSGN